MNTKNTTKTASNSKSSDVVRLSKDKLRQIGHKLPHLQEEILLQLIEKLYEMRLESRAIVNQSIQSDINQKEDSKDVGDSVDLASDDRDKEFSLLLRQRHIERLKLVEEAFQRMDEGEYGLCQGTEEPINPNRLLIMPLTRYSIEYQEQQEKRSGVTTKR